MAEPRKLIGSCQENIKKPAEEGLRNELRFLTPDVNGNQVAYPGYLGKMEGAEEVESKSVKIYPSDFQKDNEKHLRFVVRKVLTQPTPATNRDGQYVNSEGKVVEDPEQAARVERAVKYKGTDRRVYLTLGELYTANQSHKGTPYGQTMIVGRLYDEETAREVARNMYRAGNLKSAEKNEEANALYENINALKKEKGTYTSMFINKKLAAELATRFGANIEIAKEAKHAPNDDFDDDIPFG